MEEKVKGFHALVKKVSMKSHSYEAHTFIYPDTSTYMSRTPCTVYLFPKCLKDMWLNFNTELFEKTLRKIKHADQGEAMKSYRASLRRGSFLGTPQQLLPNETKSHLENIGTLNKVHPSTDIENAEIKNGDEVKNGKDLKPHSKVEG